MAKKRAKKKSAKASKKPKKKAVKKAAGKKKTKALVAKAPSSVAVMPKKKRAGVVTHFYSHISVAVVKVEDSIKLGDKISIEGATTNFKQKAGSMQIDRKDITEAKKGQEIGLKVDDKVREGDIVYKV